MWGSLKIYNAVIVVVIEEKNMPEAHAKGFVDFEG